MDKAARRVGNGDSEEIGRKGWSTETYPGYSIAKNSMVTAAGADTEERHAVGDQLREGPGDPACWACSMVQPAGLACCQTSLDC